MSAAVDLERWIAKYFAEDRRAEARRLLSAYGTESWHREPDRVRRDLVILSQGSLAKLQEDVLLADADYRDILIGEEIDAYLIDELKKGV